jgi:signal transduction histidine kinase
MGRRFRFEEIRDMTALHAQIDILEAVLQRLRTGDVQTFDQLPYMFDELRREAADLERRQDELASLYEVGQEMVSILNLDQLLESILDRALVLVDAERGFLVLWSTVNNSFQVPVARRFDRGEVDSAQIEISDGVIQRVLTSREPLVTTNAQEDPRFQASESILTYQIRSVLAAPMIAKEALIGAIYVDTRLSSRLFDEDDLALLVGMANQAAVAIQLARLYESLQTRNQELQEALRELQETQAELIQAERLSVVGRMASSIIHDLKNPMTTIKGYASLLGRTDLRPEMRQQFSQIITRSVDTFVEMTQEILDYARGGGPLQLAEVNVSSFVNDLCDFVQRDFEEKGLSLIRQLEYSGPLIMDETKMRRALYNVVTNARDAMEHGGSLTITTSCTDNITEFSFRDTGPGIPEEIKNTLFEPFVTYGKPSGTGLGLAIAKKTVEDHGGTISVKSASGGGTTFVIRVPRTRSAQGQLD